MMELRGRRGVFGLSVGVLVIVSALVELGGAEEETTTEGDLHPIKPSQNQCFDVYDNQASEIFLSEMSQSCMRRLPKYKSCVGLRTRNREVILVKCRTKMSKYKQPAPGCYRIIKQDKSEGIVCQQYDAGRGCELIETPSGLNIEVFCWPSKPGGIVRVKQTTPPM